jgi:hypothetical protein
VQRNRDAVSPGRGRLNRAAALRGKLREVQFEGVFDDLPSGTLSAGAIALNRLRTARSRETVPRWRRASRLPDIAKSAERTPLADKIAFEFARIPSGTPTGSRMGDAGARPAYDHAIDETFEGNVLQKRLILRWRGCSAR